MVARKTLQVDLVPKERKGEMKKLLKQQFLGVE